MWLTCFVFRFHLRYDQFVNIMSLMITHDDNRRADKVGNFFFRGKQLRWSGFLGCKFIYRFVVVLKLVFRLKWFLVKQGCSDNLSD